MNSRKLIAYGLENGLSSIEVEATTTSSLSFDYINKDLQSYQSSKSQDIGVSGIYQNKYAKVNLETYSNNKSPKIIVDTIKENALATDISGKTNFFKGSTKYQNKRVFKGEIDKISSSDKLSRIFKMVDGSKVLDSRIVNVQVSYEEVIRESTMANSEGLSLRSKNDYFMIGLSLVGEEDEQTYSNFDYIIGQKADDLSSENINQFVKKAVKNLVRKFHPVKVTTGEYEAILSPSVVASLMPFLLSNTHADKLHRHSSLFEGKLNTKVISSLLTIKEAPLTTNPFFRYYDDEGVATTNKDIIKNGVLKTFLYNREEAEVDKVESTGNAASLGSRIGIGSSNIIVSGRNSVTLDSMVASITNGVLVTDITGLHAGLNSNSLNFSLKAEGLLITDGVVGKAMQLFTVAGNLIDILNNVIAVTNEDKLSYNSYTTPSILIKKISVSGE